MARLRALNSCALHLSRTAWPLRALDGRAFNHVALDRIVGFQRLGKVGAISKQRYLTRLAYRTLKTFIGGGFLACGVDFLHDLGRHTLRSEQTAECGADERVAELLYRRRVGNLGLTDVGESCERAKALRLRSADVEHRGFDFACAKRDDGQLADRE